MSLTMWDIWERADESPICPIRDFELKVYFKKIQELVKKYGIKYDPESPITTDDNLIEKVWKAGLELLIDAGALCTDTERLIKFEEWEVKEALNQPPREVMLGQGKDAVTVIHRGFQDKRPPLIIAGPLACPISEDVAMKVYEAYTRERSISSLIPGTIGEFHGRPVKAGSPLEMHVEKINVAMMREAAKMAGRPGLCIGPQTCVTTTTAIAAFDPTWGWRKGDFLTIELLPNMKINYSSLCLAEHIHDYGVNAICGGVPGLGGLPGGPEGAAIDAVAEAILGRIAYQADISWHAVSNIQYPEGISRKTIWTCSLAMAAMAAHSNLISFSPQGLTYAGPCTEMYLYEIAAIVMANTVCGADIVAGATGRGGSQKDCFGGPLDARFIRGVSEAAAKLNREEANNIVKKVLAKFEDRIEAKNPPEGKRFQECNDLTTLKPTKEYLELCDNVKKVLREFGLEVE